MGLDESDKCGVTDHALQVYGCDPPILMRILLENLFLPNDAI